MHLFGDGNVNSYKANDVNSESSIFNNGFASGIAPVVGIASRNLIDVNPSNLIDVNPSNLIDVNPNNLIDVNPRHSVEVDPSHSSDDSKENNRKSSYRTQVKR